MKKLKLGVLSFSSCSGCQIAVLNLEDTLVNLLENFNIKYFHIIQGNNFEEPVDVAIIEGAITTKEQEKKLKEIRLNSKILVAMGACACTGGIPAMKNDLKRDDLNKEVYGDKKHTKSVVAKGLDEYVKVDFQIKGCPISKKNFEEAIISLLAGNRPFQREFPVCTECKQNENECQLHKGKLCLGSITMMGCKAICPTEGEPCTGCRGLFDDSRIKAFSKLMKKEYGFKKSQIKETYSNFLSNQIDKKEIDKYI